MKTAVSAYSFPCLCCTVTLPGTRIPLAVSSLQDKSRPQSPFPCRLLSPVTNGGLIQPDNALIHGEGERWAAVCQRRGGVRGRWRGTAIKRQARQLHGQRQQHPLMYRAPSSSFFVIWLYMEELSRAGSSFRNSRLSPYKSLPGK